MKRFKLAVISLHLFWAVAIAQAGSVTVESLTFALDTRRPLVGGISGRIVSEGNPVGGALVEIEGTVHSATSGVDGVFAIADIPVGGGYNLMASAEEMLPKVVTGLTITGATTTAKSINAGTIRAAGNQNLGDISLQSARRPFKLVRLAPDVNVVNSDKKMTVEEGGCGHRYYQVLDANNKPVGNAVVTVRVKDGATIPQGDVLDEAAGRISGQSDPSGIIRFSVPGTYLTMGIYKEILLLGSGKQIAQFSAKLVPRRYDRVWKHKVGGGVSGKIKVVRVGGNAAFESEIVQTVEGSSAMQEEITRRRAVEAKAGVELSLPCKIVHVGAGMFMGADLFTKYRFAPESTNPNQNLMKLYVALGDLFGLASGPLQVVYEFVRTYYENNYVSSQLTGAGADMRVGPYAEGSVTLGLASENQQTFAGFKGTASVKAENSMGYEARYALPRESAYVYGLAADAAFSANLGMTFTDRLSKDTKLNLSLFNLGGATRFSSKVWHRDGIAWPHRAEIEQKLAYEAGVMGKLAWLLDTSLRGFYREYSEQLAFKLPTQESYNKLQQLGPMWGALNTPAKAGRLATASPLSFASPLLQSAINDSRYIDYTRKVYAAEVKQAGLGVDADAMLIGLKLAIKGRMERGAEVVRERGAILRYQRMPRETYPQVTSAMFPAESVIAMESRWVSYAYPELAAALNRISQTVQSVGQTVVEQITAAGKAMLTFNAGVMPGGSTLLVDAVIRRIEPKTLKATPRTVNGDDPLPPAGADNYVYGLGGIYEFSSTNEFVGTGTLVIAYSDGEVAGLDESQLRIYRGGSDSTWELVGGIVDAESNTVACTITQLGAYAVAPPLPTGNLVFNLSTNLLPADGTSVATVVADNLMLNTGQSATQAWWYTAYVEGVTLLNEDADAETPGVQVASSNGTLILQVRAPEDGVLASVDVASLAGDAFGTIGIPVVDDLPPPAPTEVVAEAGQSRIWVSWATNGGLNAARVYYRAGQAGPPYDGTAMIDGAPSPISVMGSGTTLRGLAKGEIYYLAVSAVDEAGNEGSWTVLDPVTTGERPPHPPTGVAVDFGEDGTNNLMWALSEDDRYNDRDVVRYDVLRAVLPEGDYSKIAELEAGSTLYVEPAVAVGPTQFIRYAVLAVDSAGLTSAWVHADRMLPEGLGRDNDWDGLPDDWEEAYGLSTSDRNTAAGDEDRDGFTNYQEYLADTAPNDKDSCLEMDAVRMTNGQIRVDWRGGILARQTLWATEDLREDANWRILQTFEPPTDRSNTYWDAEGAITSRVYKIQGGR